MVHNGIIENFRELREELTAKGHVFATETDSEVVAHLVAEEMRQGSKPREAVAAALARLKGAFALVFLFDGELDLLIGARRGSPLAVGFGDDGVYLGSDALALAPFATEIAYLEEDDWVTLTREKTHLLRRRRADRRARAPAVAGRLADGRQGQLPPLHGQGNPRAARGRRPHAGALSRSRQRNRAAAVRPRLRRQGAVARHHFGLRHRLLRRARRALLAGALRAAFGRDRHRLGVSLPRGAAAQGRADDRRVAIGRDGGHAGGAALRQGAGPAHSLHRQCRDLDHRARERHGGANAGRAGDRRRLDQGLHLPARRLRLSRAGARPRARRVDRSAGKGAGRRTYRDAGSDGARC